MGFLPMIHDIIDIAFYMHKITDMPIHICKKALVDTNYDFEEAIKLILIRYSPI